MINGLVDFWRSCEWARAPYAHPDDLPILRKASDRLVDFMEMDFSAFVASLRFDHFKDKRLRLSLLPQPYFGDLSRADIVILLLNPGLSYTDYYAEWRVPELRQRLVATLKQDFGATEFPFLWLDPDFCWHGGFVFWEEKLRRVLSIIAAEKFQGQYVDALRDLSRRLASVELVPYHSRTFGASRLLDALPSVQAARRFAREVLASATFAGKATVIVTRRETDWGLPTENNDLIIYRGGQTRGASLGPNTPSGKAILRRYGIGGEPR